jgi:hypothetical protein
MELVVVVVVVVLLLLVVVLLYTSYIAVAVCSVLYSCGLRGVNSSL